MGSTIGFDLDMTLIDPRDGMAKAIDILGAESGIELDGARFAAHLGPPLDQSLLGLGAPADRIPELIARFREMYPERVVPNTVALPGAVAALAAVHSAGWGTVVITGKHGPNAALHVHQLGFPVDTLVGGLWSEGKAKALVEHGAVAYVGDHVGDIAGAIAAGIVPVGVTTGPCSRDELVAAGAEHVLTGLDEFPDWLETHMHNLAGSR